MKRRTWWFVALATALLAAFVGAWKWSRSPAAVDQAGVVVGSGKPQTPEHRYDEIPKFGFMTDAKLWYVEPSLAGSNYEVTYLSKKHSLALSAQAAKELGLHESFEEYNVPHGWSIIRHRQVVGAFLFADADSWRSQVTFPPIPPDCKTLITIRRPPSLSDVASAAGFALKWRGSRGGSL
jgi:hypothetical protein